MPSILVGAAPGPTFFQVVLAFVGGTLFYLARRASGTIIVPIVLHAMFDFSSFTGDVNSALAKLPLLATVVIFIAFLSTRKHAFGTGVETQEPAAA